MRTTILCIGVLVGLAFMVSACVMPVAVPPARGGTDATVEEEHRGDGEFQRILACVEAHLPAESYFSNSFPARPWSNLAAAGL